MGKPFKALLLIACVFIFLSAYRLVFQGVLEVPSYDVQHRQAGAGDNGLLLQLALAGAGLLVGICVVCTQRKSNSRTKVTALAISLAMPIIFLYSARGVQRFGPGFSHDRWDALERLSPQTKRTLKSTDLVEDLGEPLIRKQHADGTETWIFSYMPSCGFGWDKKYVEIDKRGHVKDLFTSSEP